MNPEQVEKRKIKSVQREAIVKIEKYANDGVCIAYENEKVIFVRYVIPGELVKINIYKEAKDYAMAEPIEILEPSPDRIKPLCPHFGLCGGCDYQMLSYNKQLEIKENLIKETFQRIGKQDDFQITGWIKSPMEYHYRNTETFKVNSKYKEIGFFRRDTKRVIPIEECLIAMPEINTALNKIKSSENFPPYNFKVRTTLDNDTTVNFIKTDSYEDRCVFETVNALDKSLKFKISRDSFFQVNDFVIPLWLKKIISFLDVKQNERIYDLYSGIGLITLFLSYYAGETLGIEIAKSSVIDANYNKSINEINTNVRFIQDDVMKILPTLPRADIIVIDPPRKGLDPESIEALLQTSPTKIIYSSCKSTTMARDIALLREKYRIKELYLVDMFPQTHHIEPLGCLELK